MELCHCLSQSSLYQYIMAHAAGPRNSSYTLAKRTMIQFSSWGHASSLCSVSSQFPSQAAQPPFQGLLHPEQLRIGPKGEHPTQPGDPCTVLQVPGAAQIQP